MKVGFVVLFVICFSISCKFNDNKVDAKKSTSKVTISYQHDESSPYIELKFNPFFQQYFFTWKDTINLKKSIHYLIYSEDGELIERRFSNKIVLKSFDYLKTNNDDMTTRLFVQYIENDSIFTHNLMIHDI